MDSNSRKPGYNIDGFITSQRRRGAAGGKFDDRLHDVRTRQPGFHVQQPARRDFTAPGISAPAGRPSGIQSGIVLPPIYRSGQHTQGKIATPVAAKSKHVRRHPRLKKVAKRTATVLAALILLTTGWLGWKIFHNSNKVFGSNSSLLGFLSATPLKCENTGRCNILLAGNSADDPDHQGADLTDSIMVISINLRNNTAFMLSIPRDLYVQLPAQSDPDGSGYGKINQAILDTSFKQNGYPNGGMGNLESVVSQTLDIPINYYALVNYAAFKDAVDAVGGVSIDIQSPDSRGLYDAYTHLKLSNGWQKLNGQQALDLARARGDNSAGDVSYGFPDSDFDRTEHQRQLLVALEQKGLSSSVLANPIKIGELFDAIGNNVHTDLTSGNIHRLYDIFRQINGSKIQSDALNSVTLSGQHDVDLLQDYNTVGGESALIPAAGLSDYSQIQLYLKQLTASNPLVKEAANVVVLNAGSIDGLATKEKTVLAGKDIDVSAVADAPSQQANNTIIDNSKGKDPATLAALKSLFGSSTSTNASLSSTYPNADLIVVLGQSQKMPQ